MLFLTTLILGQLKNRKCLLNFQNSWSNLSCQQNCESPSWKCTRHQISLIPVLLQIILSILEIKSKNSLSQKNLSKSSIYTHDSQIQNCLSNFRFRRNSLKNLALVALEGRCWVYSLSTFMWSFKNLVIPNPLNFLVGMTLLSFSSHLIICLFLGSCRLFSLM